MRIESVAAMAAAGLVFGLALFAAGCATGPAYEPVAASAPGATLRLFKTYQGTSVGVSAYQIYSLAPDAWCDSARRAAAFDQMTGNERAVRIAPDQPVVLWSVTSYVTSGVVYMANHDHRQNVSSCASGLRFTPRRDHAYEARQTSSFGSLTCAMTVIDTATGAAPEGAETLDRSGCRTREAAAG